MSLPSHDRPLQVSPVIPVVVMADLDAAIPLARALVRGGIRIIEITLRSPVALAAIGRVATEVPEILVGAGTVRTPVQVTEVVAAGAEFIVLPGAPSGLLDAALDTELPVLAGASTITEMMALADRGLTSMKFFPAEASGGCAMLSAVTGPLPELRFCPTGGVTPANVADYLALPNVPCVGGTWLTPNNLVAQGDWNAVEALARQASRLTVDQ